MVTKDNTLPDFEDKLKRPQWEWSRKHISETVDWEVEKWWEIIAGLLEKLVNPNKKDN